MQVPRASTLPSSFRMRGVGNGHRPAHSDDLADCGVGPPDRDCMEIFDVHGDGRRGTSFDRRDHGGPGELIDDRGDDPSMDTPEKGSPCRAWASRTLPIFRPPSRRCSIDPDCRRKALNKALTRIPAPWLVGGDGPDSAHLTRSDCSKPNNTRFGIMSEVDAAVMLKEARRRSGLSRRQLAERGGTSASTLSAYESGTSVPSVVTPGRLLRAAGFEVDANLRPVPSVNETGADRKDRGPVLIRRRPAARPTGAPQVSGIWRGGDGRR